MSYIPMPPRNTIAETLAQAISKYLKIECSKHYPLIQIGDTAEITSGGTPNTNNSTFWDGDIVWITPKDLGRPRTVEIADSERKISAIGVSSSSAKLLPIGTILLSSRAPIGHLGISQVPLATNQGFKNIICKNQINNRFLFHMLRGSIPELQSYGRGNTFAEIPSRIVKEYSIPLPPTELQKTIADFLDIFYQRLSGNYISLPPLPEPLAEQQRIIAKIERLAGKIEEARNAVIESKEKANALLTSELNYFFQAVSNTDTPKQTIGSLIIYDRYGPRFYNEPYTDYGTLIIRATDIDDRGKIDFSKMPHLKISQEEINKLKLLPGDLVVVRSGSIGLSAVFNDANLECVPSAYLLQFRFTSLVNPYYVRYCLQTPQLKKQLAGRGTSVQNLNANKIKKSVIPLPTLKDQHRIVAELDSLQVKIDQLKKFQSQTTAELDALLPSILDKAFKGEL